MPPCLDGRVKKSRTETICDRQFLRRVFDIRPILEFLTYIDGMVLLYACPNHYKPNVLSIQPVLWRNLQKVQLAPSSFCDILQKSNAVLTGSFLLASMLGEDLKGWGCHDVDVIVQQNTRIAGDEFMRLLAAERKQEAVYIEQVVTSSDNNMERERQDPSLSVMRFGKESYMPNIPISCARLMLRSLAKGFSIDRIKCVNITPHAFITQYFDLDFCKIAFDGRRLRVLNFSRLIERRSVIDLSRYFATASISGGLTDNLKCLLFYKLFKRMIKYRKRRFNVEFRAVDEVIDAWHRPAVSKAVKLAIFAYMLSHSPSETQSTMMEIRNIVSYGVVAMLMKTSNPFAPSSAYRLSWGDIQTSQYYEHKINNLLIFLKSEDV